MQQKWLRKNWLWLLVNTVAALLFSAFCVQIFTLGNLSAIGKQMPAEIGEWSNRWLIVSLAITPLITVTRIRKLATLRKSTGLWAFAYTALHFATYSARFSFNLIETLQETFSWIEYSLGFVAFVMLLLLAITSTKRAMKSLKKDWKRLHRSVYLIAILVGLHVALVTEAYTVLAVYSVLLLARIPAVKQRLSQLRA